MQMRVKAFLVVNLLVCGGLLLGHAQTASAQAVSFSQLSLSNLQITTATGAVQFSTSPGASAFAQAQNSQGDADASFDDGTGVSATVPWASGQGSASAAGLTADGTSSVNIPGTVTGQASSVGQGSLFTSFMITGGTGDVVVDFSALLGGSQLVQTGMFGQSASSEAIFNLFLDGGSVLFYDSILNIMGPNMSQAQMINLTLTRSLTLQYGVEYSIFAGVDTESSGITATPEPATIILVLGSLGALGGYVRRWQRDTASSTTET
jgi:hypothetical protein